MTCTQAEEAILESIDGAELPASRRAGLDAHLGTCPGCRAFLERQEWLDRALSAALAPVSLPIAFTAQLLERARGSADPAEPAELARKRAQALADYQAALKAGERAAWTEARRKLPLLLAVALALTFVVALAMYACNRLDALRSGVGAPLGYALVATAVILAAAAAGPAGMWALRLALSTPVLGEEHGRRSAPEPA